MGQKVNPNGMRLGINRPWVANWFTSKAQFAAFVAADMKVRRYLTKTLQGAAISRIVIERPAPTSMKVIIHSARPGVIIGKKGDEINRLRKRIEELTGTAAHITIEEVRKPELDATLVAENIAQQLERRVMFRRAMKRAVQSTLRQGAQGIKVAVAGRLGGAEIARTEGYREGRVPLHTFRADIDYGTARANTTYGVIGVKVWIYKGEVHRLHERKEEQQEQGGE